MMYSPIVTKLRSNKQYKQTEFQNKHKAEKSKSIQCSQASQCSDELDNLIDNITDNKIDEQINEFFQNLTIDDISDNESIEQIADEPRTSKSIDCITTEINNMALDPSIKEESWKLFEIESKKTKAMFTYKLYSLGFTYTIDKPKLELVTKAKTVINYINILILIILFILFKY